MKKFSRSVMDIANVYQLYLSRNIRQFHIGLSDYPVMLYLFHRPGKLICQNEIAYSLKRDKALVARATRNLVDLGYIYILNDPGNKLKKNLFLTEKGLEVVLQIKVFIERWDNEILADISPEEYDLFENMIDRICAKSDLLYDALY